MKFNSVVTVIILVASVLAFASLAYQRVPISAMQTITGEFTETLTSYAGYTAMDIIFSGILSTDNLSSRITQSAQSSFLVHQLSTTLYSETFTLTVTEASTSLVPTFAVLGLVTGFLVLLTIWMTLKSTKKPRKKRK